MKKRNNYTLSAEAQKIVDKIEPYKKSGFVSEAIVNTPINWHAPTCSCGDCLDWNINVGITKKPRY